MKKTANWVAGVLLVGPIVIAGVIVNFVGYYKFDWSVNPYALLPVGLGALGLFLVAVQSLKVMLVLIKRGAKVE